MKTAAFQVPLSGYSQTTSYVSCGSLLVSRKTPGKKLSSEMDGPFRTATKQKGWDVVSSEAECLYPRVALPP